MDSSRSWLVAAGCCWVNMFCVVMNRSAAVVYVGIIETFHVTREEAAWPGTASMTCYFTAALVAGILARYVAVWKITFTACLVGAAALSLCFFANGVTYLALLYGVVHGWSVGHVTLSSTVINQHFDKYRAAASGLNLAGFSLGGLIFPPTIQYFFDEYGFRGAFLLAGGIILNGTVGTLLQRIPAPKQPDKTADKPAAKASDVTDRNLSESGTATTAGLAQAVHCTSACGVDMTSRGDSTPSAKVLDPDGVREVTIGIDSVPCDKNGLNLGEENGGFEPCETTNRHDSEGNVNVVLCRGRSSTVHEMTSSTLMEIDVARRRGASAVETTAGSVQGGSPTECSACSGTRDGTIHFQSIADNSEQKCNEDLSYSTLSATRVEMADANEARKPSGVLKSKLLAVKELLSFLALAKFYAVGLSTIVMITNASIFSTVIIDFALDHGIDRWKALTLISVYTAMDLTARLTSGWITDRKIFSRNTFMALCMAIWTCVAICFAYADSYIVLLILSAVAGWCSGSTQPLVPVLYMEVVDIGRFSVAYGIGLFVVGLTALLRPSLTGYFRDKHGDYSGLFLVTAAPTALCAMRWTYVAVREKCCHDGRKK